MTETSVLVSYDMNGPLVPTDSSELDPYDGVRDMLTAVPHGAGSVAVAINSGYDINTLQHVRDEILGLEDTLNLVGEIGSVYQKNGASEQTLDLEPADDIVAVKQALYEQAAQEERKLHEQGNMSDVVGSTRVEAEGRPGDPRGEVYKHPAVDPAITTEDIYDRLPDDRFELREDDIFFANTRENIATLADVLRYDVTFTGVRFTAGTDNRIGVYRDRDDADITLDEAHAFIDDALADLNWETDHNDDWGSDYMEQTADPDKTQGAEKLAAELFPNADTHIITHLGDKAADVMTGENTYTYVLEGTAAEQYCRENDIAHTAVPDAVSYTEDVRRRFL